MDEGWSVGILIVGEFGESGWTGAGNPLSMRCHVPAPLPFRASPGPSLNVASCFISDISYFDLTRAFEASLTAKWCLEILLLGG